METGQRIITQTRVVAFTNPIKQDTLISTTKNKSSLSYYYQCTLHYFIFNGYKNYMYFKVKTALTFFEIKASFNLNI